MNSELPESVRRAAQRILDREAARLFAEELDGHPVGPAPRGDRDGRDRRADEPAAGGE